MSHYWLTKSEPSDYSIDDLARDGCIPWTGVRNYQARNFMRDQMKLGDKVLFYHSGTNPEPPAVVGCATVCSLPYADPTAFDPTDSHFDPKSDPANPTWILIDLQFVCKYPHPLSLSEIKAHPILQEMRVAQKGSRLSVQPVAAEHFLLIEQVCRLES